MKYNILNRYTKQVIFSGNSLQDTNLRYADLQNADLQNADLRNADLQNADLRNADLQNADLRNANLWNADLRNANLQDTNLQDTNLQDTNLQDTNLQNANLRYANLWNANLRYANLWNVIINYRTIGYNIACPEEGAFIAYKKASGKIIKLLIPEDAKRSSATTLKCRASKAIVLDIEGKDKTPVASNFDKQFIYEIGKTMEVVDFDENRWNECSAGIHFFINKELAKNFMS